jgi:PAP2 superfamily protein
MEDLNTPTQLQPVVSPEAATPVPGTGVALNPRLRLVATELWAAAMRDRAFATIAIGFWAGSHAIGWFVRWPGAVAADLSYAQLAITSVAIIVGLVIYERVRTRRELSPAKGYRQAWLRLRAGRLNNARLASYTLVCVLMPLVVASYTGWKVWLNVAAPFVWDSSLGALDRALHGGRNPWELLQPLFARQWMSDLIVGVYTFVWIMALQGITVWQALAAPSQHRSRFLVASTLAWPVAGNVLAAAYLSAGPWFDARSDPFSSPFLSLTDQIARIGGRTLWAQDYLYKAYESRNTWEVAAGISAMPSMHLVIATIIACFLFRYGRAMRAIAVTFVAVILIGSIGLGWHYAVDSYVGMVVGVAIWALAGRVVAKES